MPASALKVWVAAVILFYLWLRSGQDYDRFIAECERIVRHEQSKHREWYDEIFGQAKDDISEALRSL